jgi:hypothetical protein
MNAPNYFLFLLSLFAYAFSLPVVIRDVYAPRIISPHQGDVWVIDQYRDVTWNVSNPPTQITNPNGTLYLRKGNVTFLNSTLATNFSILLGTIKVRVPRVEPGDDYRVVLFGDSGNWSPPFIITGNEDR